MHVFGVRSSFSLDRPGSTTRVWAKKAPNLIIHLFSNILDLRIKVKLKKTEHKKLKYKMKDNRKVKISRSQEKEIGHKV